ncbi:MAG: Uma2 family endonuclease [Mogibacterium sp.]|nr:Uma2 family endonuclease [Mogibacterium sp.]
MTIEEMRERKEELMYTSAVIAEKSGVPLSTVQKILSGATARPRRATMEALELVLKKPSYHYEYSPDTGKAVCVEEEAQAYRPESGNIRSGAKPVDSWFGLEPSERWPRQGEYTIEDYYAVPDDVRVELIDGVIYDMGAPSNEHQRILSNMFLEFNRCIEEHGRQCEVLFAPCNVKLDRDNRTVVQPDLLVVCHDNRNESENDNDERKGLVGVPELVAEILSSSTRIKDCTVKLRKYMNAGVKEYWIIDPDSERVLVYVFEDDVLPTQYSFEDTIPVGLSKGKCSIDFGRIKEKWYRFRGLEISKFI